MLVFSLAGPCFDSPPAVQHGYFIINDPTFSRRFRKTLIKLSCLYSLWSPPLLPGFKIGLTNDPCWYLGSTACLAIKQNAFFKPWKLVFPIFFQSIRSSSHQPSSHIALPRFNFQSSGAFRISSGTGSGTWVKVKDASSRAHILLVASSCGKPCWATLRTPSSSMRMLPLPTVSLFCCLIFCHIAPRDYAPASVRPVSNSHADNAYILFVEVLPKAVWNATSSFLLQAPELKSVLVATFSCASRTQFVRTLPRRT